MATILRIHNLVKSYGRGFTLTVQRMEVERGTVTAILGSNGSGKSTLLTVIAGINAADRGTISMGGMAIGASSPAPFAWRRAVTMVAQKPYLFRGTVAHNIGYGLYLRGVPRAQREQRISDMLRKIGLEEFARRDARELSGGEAQMVALARALTLDPGILLLDEPTAHVDRDNAARLEQVISTLRAQRELSLLMATHDLAQANRVADRVVSLIDGKVVGEDMIFSNSSEGVKKTGIPSLSENHRL